jgi:uncharacterized protein
MRMKSLTGKRILSTGAAGGMGQEYARQLLGLGAELILTDIDGEKLWNIAHDLQGTAGRVIGVFNSDIATIKGCREVFDQCREISPHLDMLVNNAGVITYGDFHEVPLEQWSALIGINLMAPMYLTYFFLPDMVARGEGHIVFMSSVAGFVATSQGTPYSCSKFGLRGFGMALSGELKGKGVDVTNIYPFWVKTNLLNAPEHGAAKINKLPSFFAGNSAKVIHEAIEGIRKRKLHVYPGIYAKLVYSASRWTPIVSKQAH